MAISLSLHQRGAQFKVEHEHVLQRAHESVSCLKQVPLLHADVVKTIAVTRIRTWVTTATT